MFKGKYIVHAITLAFMKSKHVQIFCFRFFPLKLTGRMMFAEKYPSSSRQKKGYRFFLFRL